MLLDCSLIYELLFLAHLSSKPINAKKQFEVHALSPTDDSHSIS